MGDWTQYVQCANQGFPLAHSFFRQYALQHPNVVVSGTELALLPIPAPRVPNCSFAHYDFASGPIEFTHNPFDFIRRNWLDGRVNNWSGFLNRAWRSLKCGGFIELQATRYRSLSCSS
jgi:hypothetical protein